jgi:hypothetical protein
MYRGFIAKQGTGISICASHWPPLHSISTRSFDLQRREERSSRRTTFERSTHRCSFFEFIQTATEKAPGGRWSLKVSPADSICSNCSNCNRDRQSRVKPNCHRINVKLRRICSSTQNNTGDFALLASTFSSISTFSDHVTVDLHYAGTMKAMKSMNMNRMLGSLKRKRMDAPDPRAPEQRDATLTIYLAANSNGNDASADSQLDTPEANAARSVVCLSLSQRALLHPLKTC